MDKQREERLILELRSRVNDLLAAVQLLTPLVRKEGGERGLRNLSYMNQGLYRLIRTVNHMDLCREEPHAFSPQVTDLAGLCRDVGRQVDGIAQDLGARFEWEVEREGVFSLADGPLLEQAIFNMLTNAFHQAGPEGWVKLQCGSGKGRFTVVVQDSGSGFAPEKDARESVLGGEGVGMGLEAARHMAKLHGGALVLENGEGGGVRAVLSIPIRHPDRSELLRSPGMGYDSAGGFSQLLVEFSPLLPPERFRPAEVE